MVELCHAEMLDFLRDRGQNLSQLQRAGSWQAETTQKSHSHCVLVSRIAWLTCAKTVTKMASSGLSASNVSLEPEKSTVVSGYVTGQTSQNGRPWGADSAGCKRKRTRRVAERTSSSFWLRLQVKATLFNGRHNAECPFCSGDRPNSQKHTADWFCWQSYWICNRRDFLFYK